MAAMGRKQPLTCTGVRAEWTHFPGQQDMTVRVKRSCAAALVPCARRAYYPQLRDDSVAPLGKTADKGKT